MEKAAQKYELMRERLMKYFDTKGCINSSDLTDETINRVARKISEGEYIDKNALSYYFYGVAKNVLKEYLHNPERENISIDLMDGATHIPDPTRESQASFLQNLDPNRVFDCLAKCLQSISTADRDSILRYYEGEGGDKIENRKRLADELSLNLNNLRIRVFRVRNRLEKCVRKCAKSSKNE